MTKTPLALVTGHAGFVGRHLCHELEHRGWVIVGLDLKRDYDCRTFFRGDDNPPGSFDLVLHCAAVVGGRQKIEGQPLEVAVDLSIDAEMFQWAVRTRPGRVVYFSSSAAYPMELQTSQHPFNVYKNNDRRLAEDDIFLHDVRQPDAIYGWVKLTGEMQAELVRAEGVPVTVLRPFSGYGSDQDLDYPFPSFALRAARRRSTFHVWGDGTQVRDWVHIDDVVGATMACVEQGVDGPLNICTGRGTSFNELAHAFMKEAGHSAPLFHDALAPTGVHTRVGDPTNMLKVYTPRVTLEEGVARALKETT